MDGSRIWKKTRIQKYPDTCELERDLSYCSPEVCVLYPVRSGTIGVFLLVAKTVVDSLVCCAVVGIVQCLFNILY